MPDPIFVPIPSADRSGWLLTCTVSPLGTGELVQRLRGHTDRVYSVDFHPHEPLLASSSADFTVRLWAAAAARSNARRPARLPRAAFS